MHSRANLHPSHPHSFPTRSPFFKPNCPNLSFHSSALLPHPSPDAFSTTIRCALRPDYVPNWIPDPNYVRIFDTTLRDGEQSPGTTMTSKEKLDIARQISKLGVDIIEAGFHASSPDDFEAVKAIALEVGNAVDKEDYFPVICGLSRCNEKDIKAAWEAVKIAKRPRIHTFIATSGIHMEYKLKKSKEEVVLDITRRMVGSQGVWGAMTSSLAVRMPEGCPCIARVVYHFFNCLSEMNFVYFLCKEFPFSCFTCDRIIFKFLYEILGEVIKAGSAKLWYFWVLGSVG